MKVLIIGEAGSVHLTRWANQLCGLEWDVHILQAASETACSPELECGTLHMQVPRDVPSRVEPRVWSGRHSYWVRHPGRLTTRIVLRRPVPYQVKAADHIASVIDELKPDVVHSHGLNLAWKNICLPVLEARRMLGARFSAPWLYTSYGSDLAYYAGISPRHRAEVSAVLGAFDYHVAECERDRNVAREMGFRGESLGCFLPAYGGMDWGRVASLQERERPSSRKTVYLKGTDNAENPIYPGRAMTALRAIEACQDALRGYRIIVGQAGPAVAAEAARLVVETDLSIHVLQHRVSDDQMLGIMGRSRMMIALTVSDGVPSTLLEAMAVGATPIHSNLEPVAELIRDGENGLLVPAEDPAAVERALRHALSDDDFVDRAAEINAQIVQEKFTSDVVLPKVIKMYEHVVERGPLVPRS